MSVSTPFIQRPIATSLLALATMLGGWLGYWSLPVSSLPQVDFPTIQVSTQLPGASPDTIASLVTAPLERQFGQIPSLALMTSQSSFGISQVTLQFDLGRDIDGAAQDVQAAINSAGSTLPRGLPYPPTYSKVNPASAPIITLALTSDTATLREMSDLADSLMASRLAEVGGVGRVSIQGGIRPAVRIQADLSRLAAYGIGLEDVRQAVVGANVSGPKGSLDGTHQSYTIAANDQLIGVDSYKSLVVAYRSGSPVLLTDVAQIINGLENDKVGAWYQGKPAVVIDIQRQPGANVIDTVERVKLELPRLQRAMPAGVTLTVVSDRTDVIRASIRDVQFTLILSVVLVVLVVLLFLRTVRATIIAGVALPLSLIATFGVMWFCDFSLDNLSLMALTIGTGFVVDDAIVMIENIVRHIEDGESPLDAALRGAREIGFTVISLTLSLVAVFIPLLFMTGLVGRMFREFALTLTIAVVVSAVVSLTLTPMMCSRILRHEAARRALASEASGQRAHFREAAPGPRVASRHSAARRAHAISAFFNRAVDRTVEFYHWSLEWVLRHQAATLLVTFLTLIATVWLYLIVPKGFLPSQDTGLISAVSEAGTEVSFAQMQRLQAEVEEAIRKDPDVTGVVSVLGVSRMNPTPNAGRIAITLRPRDERIATADQIVTRLKQAVAPLPGITVWFQPVQDIQISTRASRALYQYTLVGADAGDVVEWADRLAARMRRDNRFVDVASEAQEGGLRLQVEVNREMAGRLGVSMQSVNDTLQDAFGQRQISTVYTQSNQYRVILEAQPRYQRDPSALSKLYVTGASTNTGTVATVGNTAQGSINTNTSATPNTVTGSSQVPLSTFARFEHTSAPLAIAHQEQFPSVTISFNLPPGAALSDAVTAIAEAKRDINMPGSVLGTYSGDSAEFDRSLAGQPWLILAAAITIYIVLGVLYESFIHPLTILSTLPSAGVGALLALMLFGYDLSVIALIGIVLLMGIVKKNAIMMIDFALDAEREQGLSPRESIVQASLLRFRPIMMTTLAALFGAIPLAIESGTGSELRNPLGVTIIGGLLLSQLLTLYTTPVIYLYMERLKQRFTGPQPRPAGLDAPHPAAE
ncbi:MAG: efflux RND transporter permease subunit [Xanthobacteraceae bacterium]|nr:efflux RND transporter permease subunit [Xanthobacteraceae bacterium]